MEYSSFLTWASFCPKSLTSGLLTLTHRDLSAASSVLVLPVSGAESSLMFGLTKLNDIPLWTLSLVSLDYHSQMYSIYDLMS